VDSGQVAAQADSRASQVYGARPAAPIDVQVYDFKRPERVSKDQMRALEALHEGFGRNFGAALSGYLRTIIEVSVGHIEQLTYSEFIHSLPNPTCFNLLKAEQLDGQLCLEISRTPVNARLAWGLVSPLSRVVGFLVCGFSSPPRTYFLNLACSVVVIDLRKACILPIFVSTGFWSVVCGQFLA